MKIQRLAFQALALLALNQHMGFDGHVKSGIMMAFADEGAEAAAEEEPPVDVVDEAEATTPEEYAPPANAENYQFQAEVHRMLDIVVNSLYQNRDVFLRELISNASDALDKFRYLTLTQGDQYKGDDIPLKIELDYDKDAGTLTIRDTGVGMTHDDMIQNLGTVARSGTTKFLEALKESGGETGGGVEQIGQFGVGFYSAFLVADRVTVASKSPLSDDQNIWESVNGESEFHIYADPRGKTMDRGTEITLHLKDDCKYYAKYEKLNQLATHYSEFVVHPIYIKKVTEEEVEDEDAEEDEPEEKPEKPEGEEDLEVEEEEEEEKPKKMKTVTTETWDEVNSKQALWTRSPEEISDDEYQSFWHSLNGDEFSNATYWTHFNAEGNINFKSLMYMPSEIPPELKSGSVDQFTSGIRMYVRKVLISDSFELMPRYLSFVKGVVDSDDLPLNVNRETLQESKIIAIIRKKLVRKTLDMFKEFSKKKAPKEEDEEAEAEIGADGTVTETEKDEDDGPSPYLEWYKKFSTSLKLGLLEDNPNRKRLMKLLRFQTLKSDGEYISLDEYVENMKEWQDEIYTLAGADADTIKKSPFLAPFGEKDVDVIFMDEPIDEYWGGQIKDYESTKFTDISRENVKFKDEDEDLVKRREKAYKSKLKPLTKWLKKLYEASIMRVAISSRLGSSPAIVSSTQYGNSANMERILRAQTLTHDGGSPSMSMKIFEINPRHPLVLKLLDGAPEDDDGTPDTDVVDAAWVLHDMAMMNGGYPISDPAAHAMRMTKFMQSQLGVDSLTLEPEIDPPEEEEEAPEFDLDGMPDMGGMNMDDFDLGSLDLD
ncbi:protein HtpG [Seminavis robusta]|uniref:Protein HtpG n=1 Tax=Seminavis robusta TaxID=568900 RepID=A0A9N8HAK4_9STRA|nr:protein HtpG [Seminavis robusta]|eukprot:Sro323_g117320.1 protein HtpG (827) ;mRNA; f:31581-34310